MIRRPYLLFLGDTTDDLAVKIGHGLMHWRRDWCVGQCRLPGCRPDLGLDDMSPHEAAAKGAKTLVIAVVNRGGTLPNPWVATLIEALDAGLDIASGMHMRLAGVAEIGAAAARTGAILHDVRHAGRAFVPGTGAPRPGRRLLTVGTDCSVGKMYTALALEHEMRARGLDADFRATGQTGILIAGEGVAVDAVIADFISGAVEALTPAADPDHWDVIEGQGSLNHPSYAGVSLGLLHGAQPDALVLCHEPTRTHLRGLPGRPLPDLRACLDNHLAAARLTSPHARFLGVSVNTAALDEDAASICLAALERETGLACVDPMRGGIARLVDALMAADAEDG